MTLAHRIWIGLIVVTVWPLAMYGVAMWVDYWVKKSLGLWMACGVGIPIGITIAIIVIVNW